LTLTRVFDVFAKQRCSSSRAPPTSKSHENELQINENSSKKAARKTHGKEQRKSSKNGAQNGAQININQHKNDEKKEFEIIENGAMA
jgi:hypothetical protein